MKNLIYIAFMLLCAQSYAGVAVIVHPSNSSSFDDSVINRIFTGKEKSFSNGSKAIPIGQDAGNPVTEEFNTKVLNKSSAQLKAYWSKLIFTGKGTPPKEAANDAEVIQSVSTNPDTIGFISSGSVTGDVKVIKEF
ncbi:phosphate ABC transporter substrate-binding protein [Pseudoalteromonas byunsanensis]|uniref:Phosphate ABC transporter substrate-binding protein n=1 Tax=Pseudoalteromonas byunsanensis TaxID=327939 RepID=A0A1S1NDV6_9GAMM|nr:phosphate ABC transporter substrate-binding protein [Pseudoalteromonas byunsanensis]OHU96543.1 phosphate ABC transporter substrate-binding protein [Pseudoalteromonas byunsanensis]